MAERKVFIAIDGSKQADKAFNWFLDNAYRERDVVYLLHVAEYTVDIGLLDGQRPDKVLEVTQKVKQESDRIDQLVQSALDNLKSKHIQAKALVERVDKGGEKPGQAIIRKAEEEKADMIVMGSRGLGTIRRALMGSVSDYVVSHAPENCAVVILRAS